MGEIQRGAVSLLCYHEPPSSQCTYYAAPALALDKVSGARFQLYSEAMRR